MNAAGISFTRLHAEQLTELGGALGEAALPAGDAPDDALEELGQRECPVRPTVATRTASVATRPKGTVSGAAATIRSTSPSQ